MTSEQELYGRKGRLVTDQDAGAITRVEELSYDLKVSEVMTRDVKSVTPDMHMVDLLELFRQARISGAPVLSDGKIVGIISLEDLIVSLCNMDVDAPVARYMTTKVITMKTYDPVVEAIRTFTKSGVGRLPVVDEEGKLAGMITKGDVTRGVLIALQNAFFRLLHADGLEDGVVSTVRAGGDTDTNAALCGALLGAVYGREAVPGQWRRMVLSCRPLVGHPGIEQPRPAVYWPTDAWHLAERLLAIGQRSG